MYILFGWVIPVLLYFGAFHLMTMNDFTEFIVALLFIAGFTFNRIANDMEGKL